MDIQNEHENTLLAWFAAWLDNDSSQLPTIFAEDAIYTECYGPEYRGIAQIGRWFADWNTRGRVLEWRIRSFIHDGDTLAANWYFKCDHDGEVSGFDGVTLADFDGAGRITRLREFQSKAEHVHPYGE